MNTLTLFLLVCYVMDVR